ncbi:hypothetical protein TVAG_122620 [Trichomonas vaginalis G3]|uniref:CCR4-Not complex component Not1 C-terminal domain-containing protein n=1 Tax=Trichomonas vaginalis (strain ATCC PRA-98 / G3) TaxID=412133 RepID=A2DN19_TRIV3|nr:nuclear-transcribed mRNA catabolic process, deadenylation-dependent decay [Trichomonas vaginalis G3]EAY18196.1 hypothetical protein TVAG_122620 [Trichomonas vaginalis G3]KAI5491491.1 nuclear-transcribed mRNA catabolic process, deadenylation-dependent decay [Trichomonas vaginalis G3]|eukprot:XP_001579182.1 hypothetical protein [Trichomonas vaginalis G3]
MSKILFPTSSARDFTPEMINSCKHILSRPLQEIYQLCLDDLISGRKLELACLLRILLERPPTPEYASIIGWFAINNLIQAPTLQLYMSVLLQNKNTFYGEQCCIAFLNEVIPVGYRYLSFLEDVIAIPGFRFRHSDLFILINQTFENAIPLEGFQPKNQFSIPSPIGIIPLTQNLHLDLPPITKSISEPPLKLTLEECVQASYLMPEEHRRHYLISYVLNTQIPDSILSPPSVLLEAVCAYAKHLLSNAISDGKSKIGWERYSVHAQLHQIGMWIGLLSISQGPPPPIYYIDLYKILRDSIKLGCFNEAVILLAGYFSRASSIYQLPCPYTVSFLQVMAAFINQPGVRLDVYQSVQAFAALIGTDISIFLTRTIEVDPTSFDLHCVFQLDPKNQLYFLGPYQKDAIVSNSQERVDNFFDFAPNPEKFPQYMQEVIRTASFVRKYYFVGRGNSICLPEPRTGGLHNTLIDCAILMGLSNNSVLSGTACRILAKLVYPPFKLAPEKLRYAFPNYNMLTALIKHSCISPQDINTLYSDILTNPQTGPIALPMIRRMMPHIFKLQRLYPRANFTSLYALTGMRPTNSKTDLPSVDRSNISVLRAFLLFCKQPDDDTRKDFLNKFGTGTAMQIAAIIQILIGSVREDNKDYSAIECFIALIPSILEKVSNDVILNGLLRTMDQINSSTIVSHQLGIVCVCHEIFSCIGDFSPNRLIPFLTKTSPGKIPDFVTSWIQLVLHPKVFGAMIESADLECVNFCLRFIICIIKLAINFPDGFYRPVARIITTICDSYPEFVVSFHLIILESVPPRFIQLRNIILSSIPPNFDPMLPPPVSVIPGDTQELRILKSKTEAIIMDRVTTVQSSMMKQIYEIFKKIISKDVSLLWKFVLFVIQTWTISHERFSKTNMVLELLTMLVPVSPIYFFSSLLDHVRYNNCHTRFAMELVLALFERVSDDLREIILIEIVRRLLCVTAPPHSLRELFSRLMEERKMDVLSLMKKMNEFQDFEEAVKVIKIL